MEQLRIVLEFNSLQKLTYEERNVQIYIRSLKHIIFFNVGLQHIPRTFKIEQLGHETTQTIMGGSTLAVTLSENQLSSDIVFKIVLKLNSSQKLAHEKRGVQSIKGVCNKLYFLIWNYNKVQVRFGPKWDLFPPRKLDIFFLFLVQGKDTKNTLQPKSKSTYIRGGGYHILIYIYLYYLD